MFRTARFISAGIILLLLILPALPARSQTPRMSDQVRQMLRHAAAAMDTGSFEESRAILMQARAIDSTVSDVEYEIGYSYVLEKNYPKALELLLPLLEGERATAQYYQTAGSVVDMNGDPKRAVEIFQAGLKRFPSDGGLHLEMGNMAAAAENFQEAIVWYEKGIESEPEFPSNYFRAAPIFGASSESVWGAMYAETYLHLDGRSPRSPIMSELLYDIYRQGIRVRGNDSLAIIFSSNSNVIDADRLLELVKEGNPDKINILNFEHTFEAMMGVAAMAARQQNPELCATSDSTLGYECLCAIRTTFIRTWFESHTNRKYPNLLFERQKQMDDDGVLDAYNHWVLGAGDQDAFTAWASTHKDDLRGMARWFADHPIEITPETAVIRTTGRSARKK